MKLLQNSLSLDRTPKKWANACYPFTPLRICVKSTERPLYVTVTIRPSAAGLLQTQALAQPIGVGVTQRVIRPRAVFGEQLARGFVGEDVRANGIRPVGQAVQGIVQEVDSGTEWIVDSQNISDCVECVNRVPLRRRPPIRRAVVRVKRKPLNLQSIRVRLARLSQAVI